MSRYVSVSDRPHSVGYKEVNFKDLNKEELRAYNSWRDQRHRCRSKNLKCSKYYQGKGIEVRYTSKEFVLWWMTEQEKLNLKKPTVGRIDHNGHYEFGNIRLEERYDNCVVDVMKRHGIVGNNAASIKRRRKVLAFKDGSETPCGQFGSVLAAARFFGCSRIPIEMRAKGKCKSAYKGYRFKYGEL